jgi:hypothetical protein
MFFGEKDTKKVSPKTLRHAAGKAKKKSRPTLRAAV